jgi:hypothetical protein
MVEIIRLHSDPHRQTQTLLPWYVNGTLAADEAAMVRSHLAECADCRAELKLEQTLGREVAELPFDAEQGWSDLRDRVEQSERRRQATPARSRFLRRAVPIGWALAAQAASLALFIGLAIFAAQPSRLSSYRTLGSAPQSSAANMVVIFRPTTTEQALRTSLLQSDARVVDGPTVSGAYVLHVASAERATALGRLRADANVVLAQPLGGDTRP